MSAVSYFQPSATSCFDIDEKLNIVPQLALSHETSTDGKELRSSCGPA